MKEEGKRREGKEDFKKTNEVSKTYKENVGSSRVWSCLKKGRKERKEGEEEWREEGRM